MCKVHCKIIAHLEAILHELKGMLEFLLEPNYVDDLEYFMLNYEYGSPMRQIDIAKVCRGKMVQRLTNAPEAGDTLIRTLNSHAAYPQEAA